MCIGKRKARGLRELNRVAKMVDEKIIIIVPIRKKTEMGFFRGVKYQRRLWDLLCFVFCF